MRMALLAERLRPPRRCPRGWSPRSIPAEDFEAEVDKVISKLLAGPVVAYAKTKNAINAATLTELDFALERVPWAVGLAAITRLIEGATAFQQRRTPKFTDR